MFKIPQNRTRIIATIGPASCDKKTLSKMINAGMDIARFNFSHGKHEDFSLWLGRIRELSEEKKQPVEVMLDLQGPRIRVGDGLPKKGVSLKPGQIINIGFISPSPSAKYSKGFLPIDYKNIVRDTKKGTKILLVDGLIVLEVIKKSKKHLTTKVIQGGRVFSHKGVNIPSEKLSVSSLTEKDIRDISWGIENKVDYIALSFVRNSDDIKKLKQVILKKDKDSKIKLVPKIERPQALRNIKSILRVSDMVMVARGDLGIEIGVEKVPEAQKGIILECKKAKKPVIVATQMMESMIINPSPTRAEVSDVANAVFDGADAVMLSGETTIGKYPAETVGVIEKILRESERERFFKKFKLRSLVRKK